MPPPRDIALIDSLRSHPSELPWLELKHNNADPKTIGRLCSALSNSARTENRDNAYILWGIHNTTHKILGTTFRPLQAKHQQQDLQLWLAQRLQPSIPFSFREVSHPDGRVVILEIPAAITAPVTFDNIPYIRIGSTTPKLTDYPERYRVLHECMRPHAWETGIARHYIPVDQVLTLIDHAQYFRLTHQPLSHNQTSILEHLETARIIQHDVGNMWNITNIGAILFATNLENFNSSLSRKSVRIIAHNGKSRTNTVTHRQDITSGYAVGFEELIRYITILYPSEERIGIAIRQTRPSFPPIALRELIANALIHQDMTITGAGPQIELFIDRIEITNPGRPLIRTDRMIDLPPRSRNETLASLMRRMGLCEEQGSGIDKAIKEVEHHQLPPPLFREGDTSMQVILYAPRTFAQMTWDERIRACYHHAVLKFLDGERMSNASLRQRLGVDAKNAAVVSRVIKKSLTAQKIKIADPTHPRTGYHPTWA